jgi:hypothetical protein
MRNKKTITKYKQLINQWVLFPLPFVFVFVIVFLNIFFPYRLISYHCHTVKSLIPPLDGKGTSSNNIVVYLTSAIVFFTVFFFYLLTAGYSPTVGRFFF